MPALPPLPEQTVIVRYLDHVDRRIRRYIRAKQKLIARLEEQKQAIIQQAVTGQIDVRTGQPYPAYKDSGVEWLGTCRSIGTCGGWGIWLPSSEAALRLVAGHLCTKRTGFHFCVARTSISTGSDCRMLRELR